jgi:hypothetical protein
MAQADLCDLIRLELKLRDWLDGALQADLKQQNGPAPLVVKGRENIALGSS